MNRQKQLLEKCKPAVPGNILVLTAGSLWLGTGILLNAMAGVWLEAGPPAMAVRAGAVGIVCALVLHHFYFLRLVEKNLKRILTMEGRRCFFSFVPWKNYFLVIAMIWMGYQVRHSAISKNHLAILYVGIGSALILSSYRYFRSFLKIYIHKNRGDSLPKEG